MLNVKCTCGAAMKEFYKFSNELVDIEQYQCSVCGRRKITYKLVDNRIRTIWKEQYEE